MLSARKLRSELEEVVKNYEAMSPAAHTFVSRGLLAEMKRVLELPNEAVFRLPEAHSCLTCGALVKDGFHWETHQAWHRQVSNQIWELQARTGATKEYRSWGW